MFLKPLCYFFLPAEGSQEHSDLSSALAQVRDVIAAVDLTVNKYERCQELQEVLARLENKSFAKLKNSKVFRKQDLHSKHRDLQYKGLVYWKTATGRLKGVCEIICNTRAFEFNRQPVYMYFCSSVFRYFGSPAHRRSGFPTRERSAICICCCGKPRPEEHFQRHFVQLSRRPSWVFFCFFRTRSLL